MKKSIALAGACVLALSACGGEEEVPSPGSGSGGEGSIVIGSFGGDTDKFLQDSVDTYVEEYGDVTATLDGADAATRRTQLIAEADGDSGSWDLIAMTDRDIPALINEGLFQKLDTDKISNWGNIEDSLVNEYCVPHITSPLTIIYDADTVDLPTTSWEAAFDDSVVSQMGTNPIWSDYFFYGAAILEAGGDPGSDMSPGYNRVAEIASKPLSYGSPTLLGQGLMTSEVQATVGPRARGAQWASESGKNFQTVLPDEGSFASTFYYCIPSNAKNPEAAHAYLDAMLDARGQEYFAEHFFYAPTVTNADLDPELEKSVGISADEQERIWSPDLGKISEQTDDYRKVWKENT